MGIRYFIFRVNGVDCAVLKTGDKIRELYEMLESTKNIKYVKTELNYHTTTYYFEYM